MLDDSQKQRIVAIVRSRPPEGRARWTVRLIAQHAVKRKLVQRVGRETIRVLLESHDLKPWREEMWCVAELDERYIEKMEDVLAVYEKPYNPDEPVVCLDEKPVSLHADVRPPLPAKSGKMLRRDNEYKRCGTANVFGVVEPKAGRHFPRAAPDRCGAEFARLASHVADHYPQARTIHPVTDNLNIHSRKSLVDCFGEDRGGRLWDRFAVHDTPKHGSWLNQAEIELSMFSRQCLGTRRIPAFAFLRRETSQWRRQAKRKRTTINWRFTRRKARGVFRYAKPPSRLRRWQIPDPGVHRGYAAAGAPKSTPASAIHGEPAVRSASRLTVGLSERSVDRHAGQPRP